MSTNDDGASAGRTRIERRESDRQHGDEREADDAQRRGECPECEATDLSVGSNEISCEACGLVIEDAPIDRGAEWRAFDERERDEKNRVGPPVTETQHDRGLSTNIGWQDRDAKGNAITGRRRKRLSRLRTWNERARTSDATDRNLKYALGEIDRMAAALGVPDEVREVAAVIYRRCLNGELIPGRSIEAVATGALYAACRQQNMARSLDEFEPVARVEKLEFGRAYRYLVTELGLEVPPADPTEYVTRFASDLDLDAEVESRAAEVIEASTDEGLHVGRSPPAFAAAAIYTAGLLCNSGTTQSEIGEVAHVSEVTIRNRYREQLAAMDRRVI